ncbi:MAG TPA: histidine phosphatase family protein [Negativicutes bacterium]
MRHGKAEARGKRLLDKERELTDKGREKVEAAVRGLRSVNVRSGKTYVWSSPLPRALATAQIVAGTVSGGEVNVKEAIATGDFDSLAREWAGFGVKDTLIIVGHEPYLSLWSARLANVMVSFKPAAAACFTIRNRLPPEGRLRWFMEASVMAQLEAE